MYLRRSAAGFSGFEKLNASPSCGEKGRKLRVDRKVLDGIHANEERQIAVVVDNDVFAVPPLPGMVTNDVLRIAPGFTRDEAIATAAEILGIAPAQVNVVAPTTIPHKNAALIFIGIPKGCKAPCGLDKMHFVDASAVIRATARHDAALGWVVDVQLSFVPATELALDQSVAASVLGQTAVVTRKGATFTLSMITWDEAKARALATAIAPPVT